jgi:hypothetical protein
MGRGTDRFAVPYGENHVDDLRGANFVNRSITNPGEDIGFEASLRVESMPFRFSCFPLSEPPQRDIPEWVHDN